MLDRHFNMCFYITNSIDEVTSYQNIVYINVINSIDRSICLYLVHQELMVQTHYNKMIRRTNNSVLMPDLYMTWKHVKAKVEQSVNLTTTQFNV